MSTVTLRERLNGHADAASLGLDHPCKECDKAFPSAKSLAMHVGRKHTRHILAFRERPAKNHCTHKGCKKSFKNAHGLGVHVAKMHNRTAQPRHSRHTIVERVMEKFASPDPKNICPNCHYDFAVLLSSKVPSHFCPGCGASLQALVDKLLALIKPR